MNYCVVALSLFSSDIPTWSADGLYSVQCRSVTRGRRGAYLPLEKNVSDIVWNYRT